MDKQKAIEYFKNQINEVERFDFEMLDTQEFQEWKEDTEILIKESFHNDDNLHIKKFKSIKYNPNLIIDDMSEIRDKIAFQEGIQRVKSLLESFIKDINKYWKDDRDSSSNGKVEHSIYLHLNDKIWNLIEVDFGISKKSFGKKINFVKDSFKRKIIFRDIEQAYILAKIGFSKPSVILAGSIIEELLREYLLYKGIPLSSNTFEYYIRTCSDSKLLKKIISHLSTSLRYFRNTVHIEEEINMEGTITKATANGIVSFIFTIANNF